MKLFIFETGSDKMRARYAQLHREPVYVSDLTLVEASSAVFRLGKSGALSQPQTSSVAAAVRREIEGLSRVSVDQRLVEDAVRITSTYSIRALDALQLASALRARMLANDSSMQFICADILLLTCASAEHFPIWNPCS